MQRQGGLYVDSAFFGGGTGRRELCLSPLHLAKDAAPDGAEKPLAGRDTVSYDLTFDDGPHPEYTPILLDLLASYHIPATFFVVTEFARKNPALIQRMQAEGHLIGFHSASHRSAYLMTPKQTRSDFSDGLEALAQLGISPQYFRPPWGVVNWASLRQIRARHLRLVLWDVMAQDWKRSITPDEIARRLRLRAYPGAVICLHDGRGNAGAPGRTIQALQTLLPQWLEQGFRFQTLDLYE